MARPVRRSLRERSSRERNLFSESIVWIEKTTSWLARTPDPLVDLRVPAPVGAVARQVFLFVIARNGVYFSNGVYDVRAAYASWRTLFGSAQELSHQTRPLAWLHQHLKASLEGNLTSVKQWRREATPIAFEGMTIVSPMVIASEHGDLR